MDIGAPQPANCWPQAQEREREAVSEVNELKRQSEYSQNTRDMCSCEFSFEHFRVENGSIGSRAD